jgi:dihydroorotate dehydrogenase
MTGTKTRIKTGNETNEPEVANDRLPSLGLKERLKLLRGTLKMEYFRDVTRPMLYKLCNDDPEAVHDLVLKTMHEQRHLSKLLAPFFVPPKNLAIKVNGVDVIPFGTAAGLDKNGDALAVLGEIFGFQESGTIVLHPREGNKKPRVAVDEMNFGLYNAQGFPSKGLEYFLNNISEYRKDGGRGVVYASVCGLPVSEKSAIQTAMDEMEILVTKLNPYVEGFVWNPFSPNTAALMKLRHPLIFYETSQLMAQLAPDKLRLVKMGPYEPDETFAAMKLIGKFLDGGGHGAVGPNTKKFLKDQLPEHIGGTWGYPSAGKSGESLRGYRMRFVMDTRVTFPDSTIIANGGISTPDDAYSTFRAGATMVGNYTPNTFLGPSLAAWLMRDVSMELWSNGYDNLKQLQMIVKDMAKRGISPRYERIIY